MLLHRRPPLNLLQRSSAVKCLWPYMQANPFLLADCLCRDEARADVLQSFTQAVVTLASSGDVTVLRGEQAAPAGCSVAIVDEVTTVHMMLKVRLQHIKQECPQPCCIVRW